MHYTMLAFSVPTYVSALAVPSSGVSSNWMHWGLWTLDDTPDDGTGSAETYVGTENTKLVYCICWYEIIFFLVLLFYLLRFSRFSVEVCNFFWSHWEIPQSVGLLWTRDRLVAEASTWQHTTLTTDRHPCPRLDSNPQSQQASGRRPTP